MLSAYTCLYNATNDALKLLSTHQGRGDNVVWTFIGAKWRGCTRLVGPRVGWEPGGGGQVLNEGTTNGQ